MARTRHIGFASGVILGLTFAVTAEGVKPSAVDVEKSAALYRVERKQAEESGAAARFPAAWLQRADEFARQGEAARSAGLLNESLALFHEARWQLPSLPVNLPPKVARIFGDPRLKHGHFVRAIAYSPNGAWLASGSRDGTVRIWDLGNGRELLAFRGNDDVKAVAFAPDGKSIASAGGNLIKVWDPATGEVKQTLSGHTSSVNCLAYRPDGTKLASGGDDRVVRVWNLATGSEQVNLGVQNSMIHAVAYSPNGKLLASTNGDGRLNVYAPENNERRQPLGVDIHIGAAYSVAFTPDGKLIATCGADRKVAVVGAPGPNGEPLDSTGAKKREFAGQNEPLSALAISPNGKLLATGGRDSAVRLWDIATGQLLRTFLGHMEEVSTLAFAPDGRQLASGSHDQAIKLWNLDPVDAHGTLSGHKGPVWSTAFSPDGRYIGSGGADRLVRIWDAERSREWKTLSGHTQAITALAYSPSGTLVASASGDRTVRIWDVEAGRTMKTLDGHEGAVLAVAFRSDGKQILSGSADHTARVWDVASGQVVTMLGGHPAMVTAVAIRPDGAQAATACSDGSVKIWNLADGKEEIGFRAHETGGIAAIAYSPHDQRLATCGADKQVRIWNLAARPIKEPVSRLQGHSGPLTSLAYSPNGQFLATGGSDQVVKVWNVQSGHEVRAFRGHTDWVTSVAFSSDGRSLVSASVDHLVLVWRFLADESTGGGGHTRKVTAVAVSADGKLFASAADDRTVKLWNPATGVELRTLSGHTGRVTAIAIAPDGKQVVTAGQDHKIKAWEAASGRETLVHDAQSEVLMLTFSPDGQKVLSWQRQHGRGEEEPVDTIRTYEAATLKPVDTLSDRGRRVSCLALSADGALAAMGSPDGSVRLWDLLKKERVGGDLPVHAKAVWDLVLTPDKKLLIAADKEGELRVVTIDKPAETRTIKTGVATLDGLLVSPDGSRLATCGEGRVELWDLGSGRSLYSWPVGGVGALAFTPDGQHLLTGLDRSALYLLDMP